MFTVGQIEQAHSKVKSGADFPEYIQEIKALGVLSFTTWVKDSHTTYQGANNYETSSVAKYSDLAIEEQSDKLTFEKLLKMHQQGKTDYFTFCKDCAATGIEKWIVDLRAMTCVYYDKAENTILTETIPGR